MSRWSEQFEGHQLHQTLRQLREWLGVEVETTDSELEAEKRRLSKALETISDALSKVDPELFPEQQLTQLNQQLRENQIWNNLKSYSTSKAAHHLREANDHLTGRLQGYVALLFPGEPADVAARLREVEEAYDRFCGAVDNKGEAFSSRLEAGEAKIGEAETAATELRTALDALGTEAERALSNWQGEYTSAQTSRAEEFSAAQIDRGKKFDTSLREWRDKSDTEVKSISANHEQKFNEAFETFKHEIEAKLSDATAKHTDILEIHGLVGTDGVAGGYQSNAEDEQNAANTWRRVAMGSFLAAAAWILLKYFYGFEGNPDGSTNWVEVIATSSLTLVLLGTGGYAARQSGIHRMNEQQMRWFALEVKAIDPFLSSLPEDKRNELKEQLTQKLFGQNRATSGLTDGSIDPSAFKMVTEAFQSVLKAAGRG